MLAENLKLLAEMDLTFDIEATGFTMGEIDLRIEGLNDNVAGPDAADELPDQGGGAGDYAAGRSLAPWPASPAVRQCA